MTMNRFPKPDFESGYQYPIFHYALPNETLWLVIDLTLLVLLMSIVAWAVIKRRTRRPVIAVSLVSVLYFGFFRNGCVCSIGAIQNVALALTDNTYAMPLVVLLFFVLPIVFTLLFGRVFCAGVCPLGAMQELVNVKSYRLPQALSAALGIVPWVYLGLALLFAVTRSSFIICRFDPFVGIFRLGGEVGMIAFGIVMLIASVFSGRPFCRFLCPYGALLSLFSRVSVWKMRITPSCINCELCHHACPVGAIRPPYENKVKESRSQGVRRILTYLLFLPLMAIVGAFVLNLMSDTFSRANKDVRLYEAVLLYEANPQERSSEEEELEAFYGQGGTVEALSEQVATILSDFSRYSMGVGAFIGLVVGLTLISLSTKRSRKTYEIDDAACVNCGRCFTYCPQHPSRLKAGNKQA